MQAATILKFYADAEEMITGIFRQQGGWLPMAVAATPAGLKMIPIANGPDDDNAARVLREELVASNAWAYAAAYVTVKQSSVAAEEAEARGDRKLDEVLAVAQQEEFESGPEQALFIFMSDTTSDRVRAYGISDGNKLTNRVSWLEKSSSPFHRLLVRTH